MGTNKTIIGLVVDAAWRKRPRTLFTVDGVGVAEHYTVHDADTPGGHRRIAGRFVTVAILERANEVRRQKLEQATASHARHVEAAARLLACCDGDRHATLWNLRDRTGETR